MKFETFWLYIVCLISTPSMAQENPWSIGLQSGYSALGSVKAVGVRNGIPLNVSIHYQLTEEWILKGEYQWIKSEQISANSANFQSFRSSGNYLFSNIHDHFFGLETGIGYQFTSLRGVDTLGQMELSAGPTWSWNIFSQWN
ncbi:MAG: outer membrane beta-barrel protein, partial [Proteobacteria bacterium]|nr:outer membrane beta-barrel protein [Pseudomonadota bacterium]